jgi:hypothetical protein
MYVVCPADEFLGVIGTKVLRVSSLLFTVASTNGFSPPPPPQQKRIETGLYYNILYGNLKSENSKDQRLCPEPQRNFEIHVHEFGFFTHCPSTHSTVYMQAKMHSEF